ncbi:MAG: glutamate racemase [Spirochaetota bacterium]
MSDAPIAFLDSGIGGIPYLEASRRLLPSDAFFYYADNAHFPYGERTSQELRKITQEAVSLIIERAAPRLIVVACNTASVVALDSLREAFPVRFVGVVPAIKPAAEIVGSGRIAVLATSRTVEDPYVSALIRRFAPRNQVELVAAGGLVQMIEQRLGSLDRGELDAALSAPIEHLRRAAVDAVVLGCTHFIHVRSRIEELLGPGIRVIDSVEGVARQTARLARAYDGADAPTAVDVHDTPRGRVELVVSSRGRAGTSYDYLAEAYGLVLGELHERHRTHR